MKKITLLGILLTVTLSNLYAQEPLADQIKEKLKSEEFSVSVLLQSQGFYSSSNEDISNGLYSFAYNGYPEYSKFDLGATRLVIRGKVDNNFLYKMQMDFRGRPSILDAQVGYKFADEFRLIAGAFKPFLSIDLDPNPGKTDIIGRARYVRAMMNTREIGLTALGDISNFNYRIGMYNGTGLSRTGTGNFLYTLRVGYTFNFNEASGLQFGFNAALDQNEFIPIGNTSLISTGDRNILGVFTKYDSPLFFGTFEYQLSTFHAQFEGEGSLTGTFGTLGVHLAEKTDILGRWDYLKLDFSDTPGNKDSSLLIFGVNHYPTQLVKLQLNMLYFVEEYHSNRFGMAANFQFQF